MDAILYVCHGSRVKSAVHSAIQFVKKVQKQIDCPVQEISFIELTEPSISVGLENCLRKGAKSVTVLPVLLLSANHAKVDIPLEIVKFQREYPHIKIKIANPIGIHKNMIKLIQKRINEKVKQLKPTKVLLVGRGSSDPLTINDFNSIVKLLEANLKHPVLPAFMAVSKPSIHEAWNQLLTEKNDQVIIVPYLFFSGTLMNELKAKLKSLPIEMQNKWILCETLGYDQLITSIFTERILEAKTKELYTAKNKSPCFLK
ncbi:sirohydrochlorin chelatase [Gottfriedia acidiceleris]|uniref:sirohydrochlorin chelatase n=1 Tax=Gottfriedia acidiceleris TaxID=371036 RepID=UPI002F25FBC2